MLNAQLEPIDEKKALYSENRTTRTLVIGILRITYFVKTSLYIVVIMKIINQDYQVIPTWKTNDITVLEYNSDLSILSFSKENDGGKLIECIR